MHNILSCVNASHNILLTSIDVIAHNYKQYLTRFFKSNWVWFKKYCRENSFVFFWPNDPLYYKLALKMQEINKVFSTWTESVQEVCTQEISNN